MKKTHSQKTLEQTKIAYIKDCLTANGTKSVTNEEARALIQQFEQDPYMMSKMKHSGYFDDDNTNSPGNAQ